MIQFLHDTFPTTTYYPFNLDIFTRTDSIAFESPVTFFMGENGTGKSTLLRAIAKHCHIHIWEERTGHRDPKNPFEDLLHENIRVEWTDGRVAGSYFASEIFRHFAEVLDGWSRVDPGCRDYFGNGSLVVKSHGQSHMSFFENRFRRKGLYLLDEPENALSPTRQLELLRLLGEISRQGNAQFIIATHSPILLAFPQADIYSFDASPIRRIAYEDTDYFRIYRDFLNNRAKYLEGI